MRIGFTYDLRADYRALGYGEEETAEFDSEITIAAITEALTSLGWDVVPIGNIANLTRRLAAGERFDAVFNICEGLKGIAREAQVPALLEAFGIPYVFSDPLTLSLALDKAMAKRIVRDCGIATADFALIEHPRDAANIALPFPLFLKPVAEGSGKGVHAKSKVDDRTALLSVSAALLRQFDQPVLVETFLPGREFTVGIVGTGDSASVLGISEIHRAGNYIGHGYGYENKEHWEDKVSIRPADDAAGRAAGAVALAAWRVLRCRDGGRVDIRNDAAGVPHFIEVNPLAGLRPDYSDLCFIANHIGLPYRDLIGRIMDAFLDRHPQLKARAKAA